MTSLQLLLPIEKIESDYVQSNMIKVVQKLHIKCSPAITVKSITQTAHKAKTRM